MLTLKKTKQEDIKQLMEDFFRWQRKREDMGLGYPNRTTEGKLIDDMPSTACNCRGRDTNCEKCSGTGRMKFDPKSIPRPRQVECPEIGCELGFISGTTCHRCCGSGMIEINNDIEVNPAFIRPTTNRASSSGNPLFPLIEFALMRFKNNDKQKSHYFVLIQEYTRDGRQIEKAARLTISQGEYSKRLTAAHDAIEKEIYGCP